MSTLLKSVFFVGITAFSAFGQTSTFQDSLLDHMTGTWILRGTIRGQQTTHDIDARWVLAHQYLQFHEISREKNPKGEPAYEAIVYIGWDQPNNQYSCLWLDITGGGGLSAQAIGHAKKNGNRLEFLFQGSDGSLFHTTFVYDAGTNTWQWLMDDEHDAKLQPFARVKLTKE